MTKWFNGYVRIVDMSRMENVDANDLKTGDS